MQHLKPFNESNAGQVTYKDILDLVSTDQIKIIRTKKEYIVDYINQMVELNSRRGRDILNNPIGKGSFITIGDSFVVIIENGTPTVIISEYELSNPFQFGDIVICPGHDSITCYNKVTGEHTTSHIR